MKKGLVSPDQVFSSKVVWPLVTVDGAPLGPYIVEVVDIGDDFDLPLPFFWVDVPDTAVAYGWYYDESTSTPVEITSSYYYVTEVVAGLSTAIAEALLVYPSGDPQPPGTTSLFPPSPATGQTLYWYDGAWVLSSFDPNLSLANAKASLISDVEVNGSTAADTQGSKYSQVQKVTAPDVSVLETLNYPGTTLGDYQTYVDGLVSDSTTTINAAATTEDLYTFNPADVPFTPEPPSASGTIYTGRGGSGGGPLDMNPSYMTSWISSTVDVTDTELYIPATMTTVPFDDSVPPYQYAQTFGAFTLGNYTVQLRQASTGFYLGEWECPLSATEIPVPFNM